MDKNEVRAAIAAIDLKKYSLTEAREEIRGVVNDMMRERRKAAFSPSYDVDPQSREYRDVIEDESVGVDYYPDGLGIIRKSGYITTVKWDDTQDKAVVDGVDMFVEDDVELSPFSVPIDAVENVEAVLLFLFSEGRITG